jgi:hypothetical protein
VPIGNAMQRFDKEGNLTGGKTRDLIKDLLQGLRWARQLERGRQAAEHSS